MAISAPARLVKADWRWGFWGLAGIAATAIFAVPTLPAVLGIAALSAAVLLLLGAVTVVAMASKRKRRQANVPMSLEPAPIRAPGGSVGIRVVGGKRITLTGNRTHGIATGILAEDVEDLDARDNVST